MSALERAEGCRVFARAAATLGLLPLLGACAVVGFPSPHGATPAALPGASGPAAAHSGIGAPASPSELPALTLPEFDLRPVLPERSTEFVEFTWADEEDEPVEPAVTGTYRVRGQTYELFADAEGYEDEGVASWYGAQFAGRRTSNGERFDPDALTAAHRSLPFGSMVEVTNLVNGRMVVVRVNDRGPFGHSDDRIIDVSRAAARLLGLVGAGTAQVEIRVLSSEPGGGGGVAP